MAGLTHLGVGLAAKRVAPKVPTGFLVVAAYAIDIVWGVFWLIGWEKLPTSGAVAIAPWSHGLFMAVVWSVAVALATWFFSRNRMLTTIIGMLVFSHWVVDFIAKPMTHAFPSDVGVPLLFAGSPVVGLGLWSTALGEYIGEYAITAIGVLIYAFTIVGIRRQKSAVSGR